MSEQLDCEIVRDLLPSYVDGQTSETTNIAIEKHISGCHECTEILQRMKEPDDALQSQKNEIDYLKKVKKSEHHAVLIAIVATLLIGLIVYGIRVFVLGTETDLNAHDMQVHVEDNVVYVEGDLVNSREGVARITFSENDGVVDVKMFIAPITTFSRGSFSENYTVEGDAIKAVTSCGIVLWEKGKTISDVAARLYAAKNPYVGDMPANQIIANAIGIGEQFGSYKNELQTEEQPYGWVIILDAPIEASLEERSRQKMCSDACLMIASVDNLGSVTWSYENGSGKQEYTITEKEASEIAGADIKSSAESASCMQKLVDNVR